MRREEEGCRFYTWHQVAAVGGQERRSGRRTKNRRGPHLRRWCDWDVVRNYGCSTSLMITWDVGFTCILLKCEMLKCDIAYLNSKFAFPGVYYAAMILHGYGQGIVFCVCCDTIGLILNYLL